MNKMEAPVHAGAGVSTDLRFRLLLCAAVVTIYFSLYAALLSIARSTPAGGAMVSSLPAILVAVSMVAFVGLTGIFVFVRRSS